MALKIILGVLFALAVLLLAASFYLFRFSCHRRGRKDNPGGEGGAWSPFMDQIHIYQQWLEKHVTERINLTSFDGLNLVGLYIPAQGISKGVMIVMHGYRSKANIDFAPEAEFLSKLGYHVIMPCQRSHDESEGTYITYGVKERFDCVKWAEYAAKRFGSADIFLAGISMGCSTVLMASGLTLPETVRGIIADCGFTSPWDIMAHVAKKDFHLPPFPLLYTTNWFSKWLAGFDFREYSTLAAMKTNKLPILFIHGDADDFVPTAMSFQNFEACRSEKEMLIIEKAGHAQSYLTNPLKCQEAMEAFLSKYNTKTAADTQALH